MKMFNIDPMTKLSLVVAIGVTVTILLGVGEPKEAHKKAKYSQFQSKIVTAPHNKARSQIDLEKLKPGKTQL